MFSEDDDHIDDNDDNDNNNNNGNDGAQRDTGSSGNGSGRRRSADRHELTVTASINANNPQVGRTQ